MTILFSKKLWRRLSVIFLSLLIVFGVALEVGIQNSRVISDALGAETWKVIDQSDGTVDTNYFPSDFTSSEEVAEYGRKICEEAEGEGLVLLKNENHALPLAAGDSVSCLLQTSVNINYGSTGSGKINPEKYGDLKTALEDAGLKVNSTLWNFYKTDGNATSAAYEQALSYDRNIKLMVYRVNALPWELYSDEAKNSISATGGTALVVLGRLSGEGSDITAKNSDGEDGSYLSITSEEREILSQLANMKASGQIRNIVVLLNTALAFQTAFLEDESLSIDACMWIGNVGITGLNAVADALVGEITPSGKLSDTYVKDNFSSPAMASWILNPNGYFSNSYADASALALNATQQYYGVYVEGIYVGYRYYETRYEDFVLGADNVGEFDYSATVAFPFGYGLSYTTFEYSDFSANRTENGDYEVKVTVSNTGTKSGKEVVEVYLQKPYTDYDRENGVEKPAVELVGFEKTKLLAPGEAEEVTVTVEGESFKTYDANGYKTYIVEEGDYYLAVGTSAHEAINHILARKGKTMENGMDEEGDPSLAALVGDDLTLDIKTYSISSETGEKIGNRLDFCDMNKYSGKGGNGVEYVSRNDWTGTWPQAAVIFNASDPIMKADLASNKPISQEETEMPSYGESNGLTLAMLRSTEETPIPYDAEIWDRLLNQMSYADQSLLVTSAIYGSAAIGSVSLPATVAQDGPTGVVSSKENLSFPSEGIWASTFNRDILEKIGDALAEDARDCGCQGMYLPGVNIHRTPFGGRAHEYFSEDPYLTGISCETEIKALQKKGVLPFVKHFVFNDEEDNRNGICIWLNEQSAREIYLKPFEYAVAPSKGNAHACMSSFNRAGCIWVSASEILIEDILRGEFGFDGVVLTDMASGNGASYMTYVDGFMNGTDMFLGNGTENALDAYASDPTFASRIRESAHRILYVTANYCAAMNGMSPSGLVVEVMPWWQGLLISLVAIFALLSAVGVVMTAIAYCRKEEDRDTIKVE